MNYKKLISALAIGTMVFAGGVMVFANSGGITISLGNQKVSLDDSITIESVDSVENFCGEFWIDESNLIGDRTQFLDDENFIESVYIYDSISKDMKKVFDGEKNEHVHLGEKVDEHRFTYSELADNDVDKGSYRYYIYDLRDNTSKLISESMAAQSRKKGQGKKLISEGLKVFEINLRKDGLKKEIKLSRKMIDALNDFDHFSFKDFVDRRHADAGNMDENEINRIKREYENDVKFNSIEWVDRIDDSKIYLESRNEIGYVYDTKNDTFERYADKNRKHLRISNEEIAERAEIETGNGDETLWLLDEAKNRVKTIDTGLNMYRLLDSPDNKKIVYAKSSRDGKHHLFVYDIELDKGAEIFVPYSYKMIWNENSDALMIENNSKIDERTVWNMSIVKIND